MNNFVILNNKEIKQFDNNVIGFPTSLNDRFILKKELKDGLTSYSWVSQPSGTSGEGSVEFSFDIDRQFYNTMLTDKKLSLNVSTQFFILNLYIPHINEINNLNTDVFIKVNDTDKYAINTLAEYQQLICHVDDVLSDTIIECNIPNQIVLMFIQYL